MFKLCVFAVLVCAAQAGIIGGIGLASLGESYQNNNQLSWNPVPVVAKIATPIAIATPVAVKTVGLGGIGLGGIGLGGLGGRGGLDGGIGLGSNLGLGLGGLGKSW